MLKPTVNRKNRRIMITFEMAKQLIAAKINFEFSPDVYTTGGYRVKDCRICLGKSFPAPNFTELWNRLPKEVKVKRKRYCLNLAKHSEGENIISYSGDSGQALFSIIGNNCLEDILAQALIKIEIEDFSDGYAQTQNTIKQIE